MTAIFQTIKDNPKLKDEIDDKRSLKITQLMIIYYKLITGISKYKKMGIFPKSDAAKDLFGYTYNFFMK